jgi:hypothetical protein
MILVLCQSVRSKIQLWTGTDNVEVYVLAIIL